MKYPFHQGLSPMSNLFQLLSRTATRVWAFKLSLKYDCSCWFGAFWAYYVITSTQPFSLIYRRRFLCLSSALLLACAFSQRSFAWPLLLRLDRLITTKLLGKIKTFLFLHHSLNWLYFRDLYETSYFNNGNQKHEKDLQQTRSGQDPRN